MKPDYFKFWSTVSSCCIRFPTIFKGKQPQTHQNIYRKKRKRHSKEQNWKLKCYREATVNSWSSQRKAQFSTEKLCQIMFPGTNNRERGKDALRINWIIFTVCSRNRKSKIDKSSSQSARINTCPVLKVPTKQPANLAHPARDVEVLTGISSSKKSLHRWGTREFSWWSHGGTEGEGCSLWSHQTGIP